MKNIIIFSLLASYLFIQNSVAQIHNKPLSMQGLNHTSNPSAVSRSMGDIILNVKNDASIMFSNPAALQTIKGIQISVGGMQINRTISQTQQWFPLSYHSNFSLLMESLTHTIPEVNKVQVNAGDTVQRPYDSIVPNWDYKRNESLPMQAFVVAPFSVGNIKFSAGIGAVEYANLQYYFRNSNMLSPDIGSFRTAGIILLPIADADIYTTSALWYQTVRRRVGSLYGYGGALSASLSENISVGISGMMIDGRTHDREYSTGRGVITFFRNYFRLSRYQYDTSRVGTSDYKGLEFTGSSVIQNKNVSLGFAIKPPTTIKRDFTYEEKIDSSGGQISSKKIRGKDKIELPWRGNVGIGVELRKNISVGLEYEYMPLASSKYSKDTLKSNPWLDCSSLKFGLEYLPTDWLAVRFGYRTKAEVFHTEGNFNESEPVSTYIYSGGIGISYNNLKLNFTYAYYKLQYEDKWATNVNINKEVVHSFGADLSYQLPW